MTYTKPEITLLGAAIAAVQSSDKAHPLVTETVFPNSIAKTAQAYEADE